MIGICWCRDRWSFGERNGGVVGCDLFLGFFSSFFIPVESALGQVLFVRIILCSFSL